MVDHHKLLPRVLDLGMQIIMVIIFLMLFSTMRVQKEEMESADHQIDFVLAEMASVPAGTLPETIPDGFCQSVEKLFKKRSSETQAELQKASKKRQEWRALVIIGILMTLYAFIHGEAMRHGVHIPISEHLVKAGLAVSVAIAVEIIFAGTVTAKYVTPASVRIVKATGDTLASFRPPELKNE